MTPTDAHNPSSTRINNRRLVLDVFRGSEDVTVADIAQRIQLSKTTLWKVIDHFLVSKLIVSAGKAPASVEGGKKPVLYRFNENSGYVISVTVYSTSVILGLTNARAEVFYKEVVAIRENEEIDRVVDLVARFIRKWQSTDSRPKHPDAKLLGIVIGLVGVIDSERGVCITGSKFRSWEEQPPLKDFVAARVDLEAPLYADNFNRYAAFAEKTLGTARDKRDILVVVAGHYGVGAGIIADKTIRRGPRFVAGEIGHMCLDPHDTERCQCGGTGCFAKLIAGDRLVAKAEACRDTSPDSMLFEQRARDIELSTIFDCANQGDECARRLLDDVITWFAIGLHNVNMVFNAEVIILAGEYRNAGPYFMEQLQLRIEQIALVRMHKTVELRYSSFDDDGPLRGGASYVIHEYFRDDSHY